MVLGGASYGGFLAMSEAHKVRPRLAGVLSFGGEISMPGLDGRPGIRKWQGPLLDKRRLHPGPETVIMLPGQAHGVDLLDDQQQARVRSAVDRYLASVLG